MSSSTHIFKPAKHNRPKSGLTSVRSSTNQSLTIPALSSRSSENQDPTSSRSVHFKIDLSTKNLQNYGASTEKTGSRDVEISDRPEVNSATSSSTNPKSIDMLLSQREQINKKIERRRKEKQKIARLKAIEDLKQTKKLEEEKRQHEIQEQLNRKLLAESKNAPKSPQKTGKSGRF